MGHSIAMDMDGHPAELICPDQPAPGLPFVFRTAFFHAFDDADRALLARGFHLAYCDRPDEYGRPQAIAAYHCFHRRLCAEYGLSRRAALFGFSRGGLYAVNYALAHPDAVACLYLDAPVLDLRSWPAGLGCGCGSPDEWEDCKTRILEARTVEEIEAWPHNPVGHLDALAALHLPLLRTHKVTFHWLRGHAGHRENERCDELARAFAAGPDLPEDTGFTAAQA